MSPLSIITRLSCEALVLLATCNGAATELLARNQVAVRRAALT